MSIAATSAVGAVTVLVSLIMTWLVAPRLTTWFKPFLYSPARGTP